MRGIGTVALLIAVLLTFGICGDIEIEENVENTRIILTTVFYIIAYKELIKKEEK